VLGPANWDGIVVIATRLRPKRSRVRSQSPIKLIPFSFPGVKWLGRDVYLSPLSSTRLRISGAIPLLSICGQKQTGVGGVQFEARSRCLLS
jgi:hypothetical protein